MSQLEVITTNTPSSSPHRNIRALASKMDRYISLIDVWFKYIVYLVTFAIEFTRYNGPSDTDLKSKEGGRERVKN